MPHRMGLPLSFAHPSVRSGTVRVAYLIEVRCIRGSGRLDRRYNPQLYRVGMAYLRNHAEAEDAMQNAYLKTFLYLRRFEGNAAFATWLTRIMINECLMLLRRKKRSVVGSTPMHVAYLDRAATAEAPTDILNAAEMKAILEHAIQRLPCRHRAVYILREVQRLSTEETATCLALSPANVKVVCIAPVKR